MPAITLTGADDATDPCALVDIAASRPAGLVEWGVLYSSSRFGQGRYPSRARIDEIAKMCTHASNAVFALHICGSAVRDFIAGCGHVSEVAQAFPRIQVNFIAPKHDLDALRERIAERPGRTVITQRNVPNANLWPLLGDLPNHAMLFDASGGRGQECAYWPSIIRGACCGYAGGLGPDNLRTELPRIEAAAAGQITWVDMESKLRDARDRFDLARALQCIGIVEDYEREREPAHA